MTSIDFLNKVHKSLDSQEYNLSYSPAKSKNYMLYCNGNFRVHFDSGSFRVYGCLAAPVHMIPDVIPINQEFDFYLQSNYDVYLLRLVNSTEKTGDICPAGKDGIIYIICRFPMQKATLSEDIETVLRALEPFGFPSLHNPKHGITFEIEG